MTMGINTTLKIAIWERKTTQTEVAKRTGIHESRLSRIIRGHDDATDDERKKLAKALRTTVDHLFGDRSGAAAS